MMRGYIAVFLILSCPTLAFAEKMSLEQVLQAVVNHYPVLKTASYRVERAYQNVIKVKSQLGWQLQGQGGVANDVSFFGSSVQRLEMTGAMRRRLSTGDDISVNARLSREDTDSAAQPNPLNTSRIDFNYRRPLDKSAGGPEYRLDLEQADLSVVLAQTDKRIMYDSIADRVIDVYFAAIVTESQIQNLNQALERTKRLERFTKSRLNLGIAENKDQLQVIAQYNQQQAQMKVLELAQVQQLLSLNQLMGRTWDASLELDHTDVKAPNGELSELVSQVEKNSPVLEQILTQIKSVEIALKRQREARKDQLDLVMYLGNQTGKGSTPLGEQDSSEVVGGVRVEYQTGLDKSGLDAGIYQLQLDQGMLKEQQRQALEDLHYGTAALVSQIVSLQKTLRAFEQSVGSEQKKLDDADRRYRKGRIDIDTVIQFENQLAAAHLSTALQRIELKRRVFKLNLLRGLTWKNISLPDLALK